MKVAVALLALTALLVGTAACTLAEDDADTAPGSAKGPASGQAPRSGGGPNGPAVNVAPGDASPQLGEPGGEDALSPPEADPEARDPYETAPSADERNAEDERSVLGAPEGRGARAHDDPYVDDSDDTDRYDIDGDAD